MKITDRVKTWAKHYVINFNATEAAKKAGYSEKSARTAGARLLLDADVKKYLAQLQKENDRQQETLKDQLIAELKKLAFANVTDFVGEGNEIRDITKLARDKTAAVSSIETVTTESIFETRKQVKLKFHSKIAAIDQLGRHVGLFAADDTSKKPIFNITISDE